MQEKISISINKNLINKIQELKKNKNIKSKSQAFEFVLDSYFKEQKVENAIILAGKKFDKNFILNNINILKLSGVNNFYMAAGPNINELKKTIKEKNIKYLKEDDDLCGTAGAIKLAKNDIKSSFFVIFSNIFFNFDLKKMVKFHKEKNSFATIGLTPVELKDSIEHIELEGNNIISFNFKKKFKSRIISAGIYLFEPQIFSYLPKKGYLEDLVFPKLAKENKLLAYVFSKDWKYKS
ncbi:MAG: hypothetical protein ISS82_02290 [Nanoarchaeota archaeon]|nr:hypothetical protein [Nanoarchaeota archaeon]